MFKSRLLSGLSLALALLVLPPAQANAACVWSISSSANQDPNKYGNELFAVSDSGRDAWAVGYYTDLSNSNVFRWPSVGTGRRGKSCALQARTPCRSILALQELPQLPTAHTISEVRDSGRPLQVRNL